MQFADRKSKEPPVKILNDKKFNFEYKEYAPHVIIITDTLILAN